MEKVRFPFLFPSLPDFQQVTNIQNPTYLRIVMWNDKQLLTVLLAVVPQISVLPTLPSKLPSTPSLASAARDLLPSTLSHLAAALTRDDQIKKLNLDILMQTRSEDSRVRLLALRCAVEVWSGAGGGLAREFSFSLLVILLLRCTDHLFVCV